MLKGIIFNIQRYSIHDGPGIRTTAFLKGCPLSCLWCHNPESQSLVKEIVFFKNRCIGCGECIRACGSGAIKDALRECSICGTCIEACCSNARQIIGEEVAAVDLVNILQKDRVFFEDSGGGITFSGGEPLLQSGFLIEALKQCKDKGFHTVVDTCGHADKEDILAVADYTDLFLYDLKLMDDNRHIEYIGVSNERILENLRLITSKQKKVWIRIPIIPGINDDDDNIAKSIKFIKGLGSVEQINLIPYHSIAKDKYRRLDRAYKIDYILEPTNEKMEQISNEFKIRGLNVRIGG